MNKLEIQVLARHIVQHTLPIISTQTQDGLAEIHGTGVLYDDDGRLFLITAAHLYEEGVDLTQFAVPLSPASREIWTLGSFDRHTPKDDKRFDVMAFEIKSPEVEAKLRAGWGVLDSTQVDLPTPATATSYIVTGYPHALSRTTPDQLIGTHLSIYTAMLPTAPTHADMPVDAGIDLFLLCDNSAKTLAGAPAELPKLHGISGGPLWQLQEPTPGAAWAPDNVLRMVGVITSYRSSEYVRAKSWSLVTEILAMVRQECSGDAPG